LNIQYSKNQVVIRSLLSLKLLGTSSIKEYQINIFQSL